ncbi:phosphoglycolate phosphatase [Ureibacillus xyleni]|uniref:Phosphoglycolate phosphatase n=1 Tax=Ureibacillus xyleni TaxID=614648 RepID=A0A285TRQ7_9BACL|nr:HAD-IIIA family hydrolase [Ureibacillus xyleni]SOC26155.1 phosphoglycolate phosphatase [Ureibacillus xyleni]
MKYVIFDFDGTLVDSKLAILEAWNTIAEKHRFKKIDESEIDGLKKLTMNERSKRYDFPLYKLPIVMPLFYQTYKKSLNEVELFEGIKDLFGNLNRHGYNIAIISSNSQENIEAFLKKQQINNVSEILCSSRIFGKDKIIRKFLNKHQIQTSDVIYVGDEDRDIVACKKVGIKVIWVEWGYDAFEVVKNSKPDYTVSEPKEILDIVK